MNQILTQFYSLINTYSKIIYEIGIGIIIIIIAFQLVIYFIQNYISDPKLRLKIRFFFRVTELFVIVLFTGLVFSESLRHLVFSVSAISAVVAFTLKDLSSSISGWFVIIFGNLYKHSDRIQIGNTVGDVIKIGLIQTTLIECGEWLKNDSYTTGRIVHLNNSRVVQHFIFNYSDQFPFIWDTVWIPIDYKSDRNLAQKLIQETIEKVISDQMENARTQWSSLPYQLNLCENSFEPKIRLNSKKDYIEFQVIYVVDYRQREVIKHSFFHHLLNVFDEHRDQVKFPISSLISD